MKGSSACSAKTPATWHLLFCILAVWTRFVLKQIRILIAGKCQVLWSCSACQRLAHRVHAHRTTSECFLQVQLCARQQSHTGRHHSVCVQHPACKAAAGFRLSISCHSSKQTLVPRSATCIPTDRPPPCSCGMFMWHNNML